ncbi:MAG TPA: MSMEG_1061 family FMN-dependent PPOX-type flavoprotein [Burkholderiaceae bacterium]|jgi:PPOX class probable FMN-dependent enzyme|nr:MSMEG_1061 family FMN-dependent PPOX-type flavoprotein [Burkholderiaceae bacterium]
MTSLNNALLVIDMQQGFDDPYWGRRNNPQAEANGLRLLAHWRSNGWPVVIVRHDSIDPKSTLRPGQSGNDFKVGFAPLPGELLVSKCVNSALIGTPLESWLHDHNISAVTVFGITTDQCVSTTTRMASNLGFAATLVEDACACFGQITPDGRNLSADALHLAHITTLNTEFARVVSTDTLLGVEAVNALKSTSAQFPPGRIANASTLRSLISPPSEMVQHKILSRLDAHMRAFIALSPMVILSTYGVDGRADASPRGDPPGFVRVIDEQWLLIPERPGNRLADSLQNVIETGEIGLLFMVPGVKDTLRVNGQAWVTNDPGLLAPMAILGKVPQLAIAVKVGESFMHCARCTHRSNFWNSETWPAEGTLPSLARMLVDQLGMPGLNADELEVRLNEMYAKELY